MIWFYNVTAIQLLDVQNCNNYKHQLYDCCTWGSHYITNSTTTMIVSLNIEEIYRRQGKPRRNAGLQCGE